MDALTILPIAAYSIPPFLAGAAFSCWLFWVWRRTKEPVCLWLAIGIGLTPILYWSATAYYWLRQSFGSQPTPQFHFTFCILWFLLTCVEILCIAIALRRMTEMRAAAQHPGESR